MGKININSLKRCIENAQESFAELEKKRTVSVRSVPCSASNDIDSMLNRTRNMMDNIPVFSQTGS